MTLDTSSFSRICINECKGKCCDPWWGIISYSMRKEGGLSNLQGMKGELVQGLRKRSQRIMDRYITREVPPRRLFKRPERYHLAVEDVEITGRTLMISLRAMFAFRCLFFSQDNKCTIHPLVTGGDDIRPPHCGELGSPGAEPGEEGYCRIIQAFGTGNYEGGISGETLSIERSKIQTAVEMESEVSDQFYRESYPTEDEAARVALESVREHVLSQAPHLAPSESVKIPGRNEPCYCGSGKKYKKCHGG